ncbi:uncharacterized protein LOC117820926 [Notolabrus celidotus]|uniref:uncharacterized protein LOC117820926 n=1 Tax=Notolabrus celidotus TaxID=1203425 RepID=UPI001490232F|nr:uncharacterized protein LOC117820926 [Notolabrus celidotus]
MKTVCLILLFHASVQLQCDKKQITAHVGGEFILPCRYDTNTYLLAKKYWCRGASRTTCEILVDSEGRTKTGSTHRSNVLDYRRKGLFVKVTHLQFDDAGVYWVGIDKMNADVMTSVKVDITQVPVTKPRLQPLSSLLNRPTCWGLPVTVRCGCTAGTAVRYTWYHNHTMLHNSVDLRLHCGGTVDHSNFYCVASNDISSQRSDILSVQVLMPADNGCIYVINMQGQPVYDCADRISTTTHTLTTTQPPTTTRSPYQTPCTGQTTTKIHTECRNQSLPFNQTGQEQFVWGAWTLPLWYKLLRWINFASLVIFLCIVLQCTKVRHRHAKRKRRVRFKYLAQ